MALIFGKKKGRTMICPQCKAEVKETDNFCSNCGISLKKDEPRAVPDSTLQVNPDKVFDDMRSAIKWDEIPDEELSPDLSQEEPISDSEMDELIRLNEKIDPEE